MARRRRDPLQGDLFGATPRARADQDPASAGSAPVPAGPPLDPILSGKAPGRGARPRRVVAVGKRGPRARELRLASSQASPLPGPWTLKAVVSGS